MEEGGSENAYQVYCTDQTAQQLKKQGQLDYLQNSFGVKIDLFPGCIWILRQQTDIRTHQQVKHYLINLIKQLQMPPFQWFWMNRNGWTPYDQPQNEAIQAAFQNRTSTIIEINNRLYNIDTVNYCQTTTAGSVQRPILRHPPVAQFLAPKMYEQAISVPVQPVQPIQQEVQIQGVWSYMEKYQEKNFPEDISNRLEDAFQKQKKQYYVQLTDGTWDVFFQSMTMTRRENPETFKVIRKQRKRIQFLFDGCGLDDDFSLIIKLVWKFKTFMKRNFSILF